MIEVYRTLFGEDLAPLKLHVLPFLLLFECKIKFGSEKYLHVTVEFFFIFTYWRINSLEP